MQKEITLWLTFLQGLWQNQNITNMHTRSQTHVSTLTLSSLFTSVPPKLALLHLVRTETLCRWAQNPQSDGRLRSFHGRALQCSHVHSPVKLHSPLITLPLPTALSLPSLLLHSPLLMLAFPTSLSVTTSHSDGGSSFSTFWCLSWYKLPVCCLI